MRVAPAVATALDRGEPVVALESTIVTHGLPRPDNLAVAREVEAAVRAGGALPATVAVVAGEPVVGLDPGELAEVAGRPDVRKVSARDLGSAVADGAWGGTTVAATAHLAGLAGIDVFATGGLGGVHRGARETWDESADLQVLASSPLVVVCSGVKSILDVRATLERLETLGVGIAGWRTDRFPGFYLADSGQPVPWRVDDAVTVAAAVRARRALGVPGALVVARTPEEVLDPQVHDEAVAAALRAADDEAVTGARLTPYLLARLDAATGGGAARANRTLVVGNARLAAELAVAISAERGAPIG